MLRRGLPGWTGQSLKRGGRVVGHHIEAFVGIDTSKLRNAVAVADSGRGGEVRYLGEFPATEAVIQKLGAKLAAKYRHLTFCHEAGPTGYGLYRLLKSFGHECLVVAPSLVPKKAGDRVSDIARSSRHFAFVPWHITGNGASAPGVGRRRVSRAWWDIDPSQWSRGNFA
jgi:hypothetical protein